MKLIDLMLLNNENSTIVVFQDSIECARYDGKESIPPEFNNETVLNIAAKNNELHVDITY